MAGKMKRTVAKVSEKTLKIEAYLKTFQPGEELSFIALEVGSGVKMDTKGKGYLRTALKRAKLEYSPIHGEGIKLANPEMTMPILINKLTKVDRAVKRADKSHKNLQTKFFASLTKTEQNQLLYVGAVFGAIRVAAENGKLIYSGKNKMSNAETLQIPVPRFD